MGGTVSPINSPEIRESKQRQELLRREVVAFRADLAALRSEFHDEIAGLRKEFHDEMSGLRKEFHDEMTGLHNGVAGVRDELTELRTGMDWVRDAAQSILDEILLSKSPMTKIS